MNREGSNRPLRRLASTGWLGATAALLPVAALAAPMQDNVLVYPPTFFASAQPQDALDMVERLPGFVLVDSDADIRGFASAAGNVLIDGKVPSSKSESLKALLRRIPAASVARIEVIRGGAPGIDMGGHAVVANIVRVAQGTQNLAVELGEIVARDHVLRPNGSAEWSRRSGDQHLDAAIEIATEFDDDTGTGSVATYGPDGALVEGAERRQWEVKQTLSGRGGWETPLAGGTLSTNASLAREAKDEDVAVLGLDGETVAERKTDLQGEIGAQWRRGLGGGMRLDLIALQRRGWLRTLSTSVEGDDQERFDEESDTAESIGRVVLRRERGALVLEAAAEGAINRLDSAAALTENGAPVALPGGDAHVRETRAELSLNATWQATHSLVIEPSLGVERSAIRQRGDTELERRFIYWKPRLALSHALGGDDQLRASVQRVVGQLDFQDFVASASLDRDQVSAGAVDLRPPRTWQFSVAYEHHFGKGGAIVVEARHESITDVVDHTILRDDSGDVFDVVGNIGNGTRDTLSLDATLPLQSILGIDGARIEATVDWIRSRVTDPTTADRRPISEDKPIEGSIAYLHDLPGGKWSWGVELALAEREREYRLDEVRSESYGPRLGAHVDYRPAPPWTIRLEAANVTALTHRDRRDKYEGLRDTGAPDEIEVRRTATTPTVVLSIRRSFGSGAAE
ncbi:MAG TPA: TonB-dependent receptor plug domain-containing protein [Sphingomonas sp.]|nr:TonB-dependent receptor plug domain-containing protein [Sphingomonas sp.]